MKILPFALLCALPLVAVGQTAGGDGTLSAPDHPLSLQECVARAVERNPNAAAFLHAGRAAMARVGASRSAYWPTASLSGSLSRSYTEPASGTTTVRGLSGASTSDGASLGTQVTLWDSGQRKAATGAAQASYEASDATFRATVQDLALQVQSAYFGLEGAQWNLQVAQETLKQARFHLDMAKAQQGVGLVPLSDVLQAATSEANARLGLIQAENGVATARTALAVLMGLPADSTVEIRADDREGPLPDLPEWRSGRERALASLPEIRAAFKSSEALRLSIDETRAAYRPTVTADGSYGYLDAGNWPDRKNWSVGLTLHVPVFTGFARKYQVIQATESWEQSKMALQGARLSSEKAAYDARTQLATALQAVEAAQALVMSAQENSDVAEGRYKNGLGSMTNVIDALTSLTSAKVQLIGARLSALTAFATWNRSTGVDLLGGASLPSTAGPDGPSPAASSASIGSESTGEPKP